MAVDPNLVDEIAASVADIYREAETAVAELVARHLRAGLDSPTAERRLADIRALRRGAQAIIAALEADGGTAIRDALSQAYRHGWRNAVADLPRAWFERSGIGQAAAAAQNVTGTGFVEALAEALTRDFGAITRNILRDAQDAYRSVQAAAAARILTGAQTRRDAAQSAWQRLVDRGITGFTDRAGRRWRLSSYVEMATRTNAQRAAITGQVDRLDRLGVNLVYVSDAPQECRLCRPFEGKILRTDPGPLDVETMHATRDVPVTVTAYATLDQARARGFQHPNCRHSVSAYLPGVTRVPQATADPDGDEARQRQRAIERKIRRQKEREATAITPAAAKLARKRARDAQAELRAHLAQHPELKRLRYREQIGAGNIPPGRSGPAAGDLGPPTEPTLDGGPAPAPARRTRRTDPREELPVDDRRPGPDQPELEPPDPPAPADPLDGVDLTALPDDQIAELFEEHAETPGVADRLLAEMDRRDTEAAQPDEPADDGWFGGGDVEDTPEDRRIDELVAQGWEYRDAYAEVHGLDAEELARQDRRAAVEGERREGETLDQTVRRMYDEWVYDQYLQAEDATRGVLLSREGVAASVDPISLFSGPRDRARKYASEELKRWWVDHPRMTFTEFKADALGRDSDQRAARRSREGGGGREFGL